LAKEGLQRHLHWQDFEAQCPLLRRIIDERVNKMLGF
jgi:hypothetical protein